MGADEMSGGASCKCPERMLSIAPRGNLAGRLWRVLQRRCNHSAFNGYHRTRSDYSSIQCLRCGAVWRTKSDYVFALEDRAESELNITPGYDRHADAMAGFGRSVL